MIRGYFLCLILLFVGSLAHRGSHGGSHEEGLQSIGSFAKLISDFAKNLNFTQIEAVMDIVREQNLTKGQIRSEIEQWAASQSTELQQAFAKVESEIDALKKNLTDYFDGKALNLSTTAREFYDDYKEIFQSEDLTMKDECEAINNITSSITDSAVKRELEQDPVADQVASTTKTAKVSEKALKTTATTVKTSDRAVFLEPNLAVVIDLDDDLAQNLTL
uniref:SXP/RAL-2 family protein Ani s 5-like cation-binding domain-containing protein n=1 Tax=Panagrolaimus sp. JU765 TaxID=591449 RepID=A0AC34R3S9_9BILA